MRVAMVASATGHHDDRAGGERFDRVARLLATADHEVRVFCPRFWDDDAVTHEVGPVTYRAASDPAVAAPLSVRLPPLLVNYRPDVVHVRPTSGTTVAAAALASRLTRAPLVADWYGDEPIEAAGLATGLPDRLLAPSELVRTRLMELGADADDVTVVPESIDFGAVEESPTGSPIEVVTAHPLEAGANVDELLLALAELRDREWSATVIGDGPLGEEYRRQAADLRIDDRVTFAGDLDRAARLERYRGAHVFVHTAGQTCFATELCWALAAGCVGVAVYRADASAHELLEGVDRGFRVTDVDSIADAIVDCGDMERRSIDRSFERFDHDRVRERYESVYADAVAEYGLL